jgi:uncharacterized protein (TIGR02680 family)
MTIELPHPERNRWQPVRGGLLNIYRYDYEEFRYERGHLLLRGNNGTGKSRVLALQLPFLLDGEVSPYRVEPDGDPAKHIEWNLLLEKHDERLGYTWIEFGRRDDDGAEHFVTLGCGLHAAAGRGLISKWFFVSSRRVGRDLFLQSAAGNALTRDRLEEHLGDDGKVYVSATAYRAAVDQALFKLGSQRYDALLDLLIKLRQPQLSRHLDEKRLSGALSEALPPLPRTVILDIAESFRSLEAERTAIETLGIARTALDAFIAEYSRYVQIAVRRRAQTVRSSHATYEDTMRKLRGAESEKESATRTLEALARKKLELAGDEAAAQSEIKTLEDSPQMRGAKELDRVTKEAKEWRGRAEAATTDYKNATEARDSQLVRHGEAVDAARSASDRVALHAGSAETAASLATLAQAWRAAATALSLPDGPEDLSTQSRVERRLAEEIDRRREAIAHIRSLSREVDKAADKLRTQREEHARLVGDHEDALEDVRTLADVLRQASQTLVVALRTFRGSLVELRFPGQHEDAEAALSAWCESLAGTNPLVEMVRRAYEDCVRRLTNIQSALDQRHKEVCDAIASLEKEAAGLREGRHDPPPAPHTRDEAARRERAGAPFWALCDFAEDLDEGARAGLEAALEAAGLLDAWLTPDGRVLTDGRFDTQLAVGTSVPHPDSAALGRWLLPTVSENSTVPAETVAHVLTLIGAGPDVGQCWVSLDGRWQVGPLHGHFGKVAALHIGHTARERRRRERLAAIESETTRLAGERVAIEADRNTIVARLAAAEAESASAPSDEDVRRAHADHASATRTVDDLHNKVVRAGEAVLTLSAALEDSRGKRDVAAQDLGLIEHVGDLDGLERQISNFAVALASVWPNLVAHRRARKDVIEAANDIAKKQSDLERRTEALSEAVKKAAETEAERATLEATVGAAAEEVLLKLDVARRRLKGVNRTKEQLGTDTAEASSRLGGANSQIETYGKKLEEDGTRREESILGLKRLAAARLLAICDDTLQDAVTAEWSTTTAVDIARRIEARLSRINSDDAAWESVKRGIFAHFQSLSDALLRHEYSPTGTSEDDVFVVTVPFRGRNCTVTELRAAFEDEISQRSGVLSAREREILENHLVGEVSMHLHELIRAGERWVDGVNAELRDRPTSTGLTLRFDWRQHDDAPAGFAEARKRLLRSSGTWSPAEREALGTFLHQQISAARAANLAGSWQDHLTTALDYRAWHQFVVERQQDGVWKRLTRRTHGTGSSGEKALALTIPQFAAAAAHYRSADPMAPRLILLDEVFVGIDNDMRGKCMGLLDAFDLDFVMTSEREWACYPTLPGVAIYQLATRPGIDAVHVTRWVWNGRQRLRSEQQLPSPVAPPEQPS